MSNMDWKPIDWVPESFRSLFVVVSHDGRRILTRHEGEKLSFLHEFKTAQRADETCQPFREEIRSHFNITSRIQIMMMANLSSFAENYMYVIKVVAVLNEDTADVTAPFSWLYWRSSALDFKLSCPHPHVSLFLMSYLSGEDVEDVNLSSAPWRRLGYFKTFADRTRDLASRSNHEITGELEQVHLGPLSTVYKVSTDKGVLFAKIGSKGTGELRNTKVLTTMFPDHTPDLIGSDDDLNLMLSEDHGPSLLILYVSLEPIRPLNDNETKAMYEAMLAQWTQVQNKKSMGCVDELLAAGVAMYDVNWIREAFGAVEMKDYLHHWEDYGDLESLMEVVMWTRLVRYVIEAVCEIRRNLWIAKERRWKVHCHLEDLVEAWKTCESEIVIGDEISGEQVFDHAQKVAR